MKILKDGFRADMERIKRELTALQGVSIHVGILGDAGSDILMIAGVHEYGSTISAKNVKHLAIPLNMEAMAVIYAALIIKGKKTLEQVPAIIRGQVVELLKALEVEV